LQPRLTLPSTTTELKINRKAPHKNVQSILESLTLENKASLDTMQNERRLTLRVFAQNDFANNIPKGIEGELAVDEEAVLWVYDTGIWRPCCTYTDETIIAAIEFLSEPLEFPENDACVEYDGPGRDGDLYFSFEMYYPSATFDTDFVIFEYQEPTFFALGSPYIAYLWQDEEKIWWWNTYLGTSGIDGPYGPIAPDTWITVEVAWIQTTTPKSVTMTINGETSFQERMSDWSSVVFPAFGWFNNGSNEAVENLYSYMRNFKIGTSAGDSDLLEWAGSLSEFAAENNDYQSGEGNVALGRPDA
jgi:hypothetical protein